MVTGWIPIPFKNFDIINLANLPIDPINKPPYYYTFVVGGSYAVYAQLEDPKNQASKNDGDNYPHLYSVGTNKRLIDQAQGLVGYWPFDEGTGTIAYDYSGNGNNGTLVNNPQWVDGKVGKALMFNGTNYITIPLSTSLMPTSAITILLWQKPLANVCHVLISTTRSDFNGYGHYSTYELAPRPPNSCTPPQPYAQVNDTNDPAYNPCPGRPGFPYIQIGVFDFVGMTYDKIQLKTFYNAQQYEYSSCSNDLTYWGGYVEIGRRSDGYYANGIIDEIRIYNRALSDSEIKSLYEATK
jgi:hypothetical protein